MQLERVSIHNPCHAPQNTVSVKRGPRGSSGINGDADIFRQSVYLILMLSNRSQRRPRRLASRARLPIHPSRLIESITMAAPLFRVMSALFHLSLSPVRPRRRPPGRSPAASQVLDTETSTFTTRRGKRRVCAR